MLNSTDHISIENSKAVSFGLKQTTYGKNAVQDGLNTGNRLFDVLRAMIIFSRVFIDDTRLAEQTDWLSRVDEVQDAGVLGLRRACRPNAPSSRT